MLQFHGVPDRDHPWVHTPPDRFERYMKYLYDNKYTVIALRDLAKYVEPEAVPSDPTSIIRMRKTLQSKDAKSRDQ